MGLLDAIKGQVRSVIEWKDPSPDVLIWRWEGSTDELKNASKLVLNPGQCAIFVYEGIVEAIHKEPGVFNLKTANVPFWTTLSKVMQGFESEHKAAVYFIKMTEMLNQKWGTKAPIKYDDPKYKFPVGLRANGNFSFKITEPSEFFVTIAGTRQTFTVPEIRIAIVDRILTPLTDLLAESGFSYAEVDKKRVELSDLLKGKLTEIFEKLGFALTDFRIENTDFDDDTKKRIDRISDKIADAHAIKAMGEVDAASMRNFATVESLNALNKAAANPGGGAGLGVGLGAGMGMGQAMTGAFSNLQGAQGQPAAATVACSGCQSQMDEKARFCPGCGKPNSRIGVCVSCAKPLAAGAKFCPECGASQQAKCPSCKADISPGAKFCPGCGNKMA